MCVPFLGFGNLCIYLSLDFGGFRSGDEKADCRDRGELGREMGRRVTNETMTRDAEGTNGMGTCMGNDGNGWAGCACSL